MLLDCDVVIDNSLGGETWLEIGNSSDNVIGFGPNSTLTLQSPFNTNTPSGRFEFNGAIISGSHDLGLTGNVSFGTGHDSSGFNRDILLNSASKLIIDAGTVLSAGRQFQIYGTGSELELNGANVVNGPGVSVGYDYDFLIDANANQDNFGWLDMGTGTVTLEIDAGVSLLAFADSSSRDWTGGKLKIINFVPSVVRFGTHSGGITAEQLALITAYDSYGILINGLRINGSGFLTHLPNQPPAWNQSPVNKANATAGTAFSATLADHASDIDNDGLTYAKVGGPDWLGLEADGRLSGTPANADQGPNSFTVSVTDAIAAPVTVTLNIMVDPPPPPPSDYEIWSGGYENANLTDPAADLDGDGLKNDEERIWGLDPTDAASSRPIVIPLDSQTGTFRYTRRDRTLTMLTYTVWTSANLKDWTEDTGAEQNADHTGPDGVQNVDVTLSPERLGGSRLFVQVRSIQ